MRRIHWAGQQGTPALVAWFRVTLQVAGLILSGSIALFGQRGVGVIYGHVTDSRGNPQRLMVRLLTEGDVPVGDVYTDAQGQFAFEELPSSEYWVVVEAQGFRPVREHIRLDEHINPRTQANIFLEPEATAPNSSNHVVAGSTSSHKLDAKKPAPAFNQKATREFDQGSVREKKGDLRGAVAHYEKAVRIDPRFYPALNNLGAIYVRLGNHQQAEEALRKALELNPEDGESYVNLGHVMYEEGRYREAVAQLGEGIKRSPGSATGHFFLGSSCLKLGDLKQAEASLKKASVLDPKGMPAAHLQLANVYLRARDLAGARAELENYLRTNPGDPQASAIRKLLASIRAENP